MVIVKGNQCYYSLLSTILFFLLFHSTLNLTHGENQVNKRYFNFFFLHIEVNIFFLDSPGNNYTLTKQTLLYRHDIFFNLSLLLAVTGDRKIFFDNKVL